MRRFFGSMLAGLLVCGFASMAQAELDTFEAYGNGAGPSIDGTVNAGFVNNGGGSYSITAGGADIWGNSDTGVFVHEAGVTTSGDFTAIVRAESYTGPDPLAGEWGRSGPMARANATDAASANVMTTQKSGGGVALTQQGRQANGGGTERNGGEWAGTADYSAAGGNPIWLSLSRTTLPEGEFFVSHYALDDGGAPGAWSDPRFRPVTPDLAGDLSVGLAHQSHSVPRVNTANFDNWSIGGYDASLPAIVFPSFLDSIPSDLPAPGAGMFGVLEVTNNGGIGNQDAALASLAGDGGVRVAYHAPSINFNENGGEGVAPDGVPFETDVRGLLEGDSVGPNDTDRTNNIAIMARAQIQVPEAGKYVFRTDSDDGFRVFIPGQEFSNVVNGGEGIFTDGVAMQFLGGRGTAATTGEVSLDAGTYDLFWTYHEGGGGAAGELTYSFGDSEDFVLLGAQSGVAGVPTINLVPEPSSTFLALGGIALLGLARRRRA